MFRAPLLRLLAPFAVGILVGDALDLHPSVVLPALLLAGLTALLPGRRRARAFAEAGIGCALGGLAIGIPLAATAPAPRTASPGDPDGGRAGVEAAERVELLARPLPAGRGCSAPALVGDGRALLVGDRELCRWLPGQVGLARVRLEPHRCASNPGQASRARRWQRRGFPVRAHVVGGSLVPEFDEPDGPEAQLERLRRRLGRVVDPEVDDPALRSKRGAPPPVRGVLRALATGDRSRLAPEARKLFEHSGTAHLLAISGLHVGLVFALVRSLATFIAGRLPLRGAVRRGRAIGLVSGLTVATAYAILSGPGVPALRAALMAAVGTTAILGGRPAAVVNALAGAGLVVLVLEPAALFEAGTWLSFAAVIGILLWRPAGGAPGRLLGCSLGAGLATAPVVAGLGLPLPVTAALANVLAVPWFGLVIVPLTLLWAALGALGPEFELGGLEIAALAAGGFGLRLLAGLQGPDLFAALADPVLGAGAVSSGALGLRLVWRGRSRAAALAVGAAALVGVASVARTAMPGPAPRDGRATAHFFDVGHGDATLIRSGESAWLVDAGSGPGGHEEAGFDAGRWIVLPALRELGVERLERLVLTHADLDHVGGARSVLEQVPVGELWITLATHRDPALRGLREAAATRGVPLRLVARGTRERFGQGVVSVLWPPGGVRSGPRNDGSLVLRVDVHGGCLLLPGDASSTVEGRLPDVDPCEVLKLGHHGSGSSTGPGWLARLDPELAVASAGARRARALPHPRVRSALALRHVTLWETRRHGAVRIELGPGPRVVAPFVAGHTPPTPTSGEEAVPR